MKILFLQKRSLFPANTGGKIRTLNVLRHLAQWHEVTYLCNVLPHEETQLNQMRQLGLEVIAIPWKEAARHSVGFYVGLAANLLSKYPYSVNKDFDPRVHGKAAELLRDRDFDLLVCDFVQMSRNAEGLDSVPRLLFQHNVESMIYRRMADNEPNVLKRWFIRSQQTKMESFECQAGKSFDRVVAVSRQDQTVFLQQYGWGHVDVIDTAVDIDYFQPIDVQKIQGRLVFVGSMDWLPNQEGMLRFVKDILPRIQQRHPEVTLDIVGRNPSKSIARLSKYAGVTVTGSVDDVRPFISQAMLSIVPLYAGGGTRLKIFESMAMSSAVVSTTLGADGLDINEGEHWLRADSDAEFSDVVCELLEDPGRCNQIAQSALKRVQEGFGSEMIARQFEAICDATRSQGNR